MLVGLGRRSELSIATVVATMLAVLAFAAVAAPRLLTDAERSSLDLAIEQAPRSSRQLSIRVIDDFGQGFNDDPLEEQRERLEGIAVEIDDELLDRYGPPRFVADTSRFSVADIEFGRDSDTAIEGDAGPADPAGDPAGDPSPPALPTFLTFRVHPELHQYSRVIEGRAAVRSDRVIDDRSVIEFELSPASAEELGWELGQTVLLTTDPSDLVTRQFTGGLPDDFVGEFVGVRELAPPDDPYWFGDVRLHRPTVADTGIGANVFAFAMIAPDQLPTRPFRVDQRSPFSLEQRRDLIDGAITLDTADAALAGLTSLDASFSAEPTLSRPGVRAGLGPVLAVEQEQRQAARSTLVLAAVGVFGVAFTTLGQLLTASAGRRRGWLTVARARGASRMQLVVGTMTEVGILAAIAVGVGGFAGALAAGGSRWSADSTLERSMLLGLWLGAVSAAVLIALAESMRQVTVSARPQPHPGLGRWGRVGGALLVAIALASIVTFRRRGLAVDSPEVDPLVVLLPVIVPLAIVYLARWVVPLGLRKLAARGLALGPGHLVGLRRVASTPETTVGVLTVFTLALTVAGLGVSVDRSIGRGAVDASWVAVGAPFRLDTRDGAVADEVSALPGAVVSASGSTRINVARDDATFNVQLITVDTGELAAITAGTAADETYPASLDEPDGSGRIAAIASNRISGTRVRVGDELSGLGSRSDQVFVVVETRAEAFGRRNDWLLADRSAFSAVTGVEPSFNTLAIDVSDEARDDLAAIAERAGEQLDERVAVLDVQRDDPLARSVRRGYLVAGMLAVLLALIALVAVAVVTARERRREVAILGLLGAGRREIRRAVAAELVPATLAGVLVGAVVGWAVVRAFDGRYDLSAFAAGSPVSIRPDLTGLLAVAVALAVAAVAVIVVLVRRIVSASANEILRIDGAA